jgi:hypothetical protein
MSVTKLGVSVEKVVATIDIPNNHHGIERPERKNSPVFFPARLETAKPMANVSSRKPATIPQSKVDNVMLVMPKRKLDTKRRYDKPRPCGSEALEEK